MREPQVDPGRSEQEDDGSAIPAAITGKTQIDVTAIWTSVWNSSRRIVRLKLARAQRLQLLPRLDAAQRLQLLPRLDAAVDVIEHEAEEDQARASPQDGDDGGPGADGLQPPQERQPVGEADREEELRHDRVGIAAIRIVMLEDRRHRLEAADEVDQQHADDGVAAELVEGIDPGTLRGVVRHEGLDSPVGGAAFVAAGSHKDSISVGTTERR